MEKFRWAVVGTGHIASDFTESMRHVPDAEKTAVIGTSMEKAQKFAQKHGFMQAYDDMGAMLEQEKPDAVYIAVPNRAHHKLVMQALDAGINVLCEKPMADNAAQLEEMVKKAREKNVFLMEGMWTRCFPAIRKAKEWIDAGRIGEIRSVRADFGIRSAPGWQSWKASAEECAGALRDVGIYSIAMALLAFSRTPDRIDSMYILKDGADTHGELMFHYGKTGAAYLTGSFDAVTDHRALIYGDRGMVVVGDQFWRPGWAKLYDFDAEDIFTKKLEEEFRDDYGSHGFQYEIAHVQDCVRAGKKESAYYPLSESMDITKMIDGLRREWGIRYPTDRD